MDPMIGRQVGNYVLEAQIGSGGMGVVYRARDTRLERAVAIKVLPPVVSADPDRIERLLREARTLASLNHPHIAAIHSFEEGDGVHALVMELADGMPLSGRLASGALALDSALAIARQIASALEAAHDAGVIHRDIKPGNVMMTPDGRVKVLDFGLAKTVVAPFGPDTSTVLATQRGQIVGTPGYMSPEQARALPIDRRADVWAFGCVLFELLTGRPAFPGATTSDAIAAVLKEEPDWAALPAALPQSIRDLLVRCLQKDPALRLRDMRDARLQLEGVADRVGERMAVPGWMLALSAGLIAIVVVVLSWPRLAAPDQANEPPQQLTNFSGSAGLPSLSTDGRWLTFVSDMLFGGSAGSGQVYVKALPEGEAVAVTNQPFAKDSPIFTPDNSRIVYTGLMPQLRWDSWQVPAVGGAPSLFLPNAAAVKWVDRQRLLYSSIKTGAHMGVVTSTPTRADEREVYFPASHAGMVHRAIPSPDGRWAVAVEMDAGTWLPCRLLPIDGSSDGRQVGPQDGGCTTAAWSPDGRWIYLSSNAGGEYHVWRQRFPDGTPQQLTFGPTEQEGTAVTPDGGYLITSMGLTGSSIRMHDASGDRALTEEGFALWPAVLPDRNQVLYLKRTSVSGALASGELWSVDLETGAREIVLPGTHITGFSVTARQDQVVYTSAAGLRPAGIWIGDLDRRVAPKQVTAGGEYRAFVAAPGEIVYMSEGTERRLHRVSSDGTNNQLISADPVTYLATASPDGNWAVVVAPAPSGRLGTQLELRSLHGDERMRICTDGCSIGPRSFRSGGVAWSQDGSHLFITTAFLGVETRRTLVLPYRSGMSLRDQWPKGLATLRDALSNPGAALLDNAGAVSGGRPDSYVYVRQSTHSNLFRLRIPE